MTTSNFTTTATRIATFLAIFGFLAFASQTAWAQKGNGAGKSGNHHQAAAKSKQKSNTPKVNRNDKTYGIGKSISAGPGPLPTVDQDNKYRRRGNLGQNGGNQFAQGGAGTHSSKTVMPPANKAGLEPFIDLEFSPSLPRSSSAGIPLPSEQTNRVQMAMQRESREYSPVRNLRQAASKSKRANNTFNPHIMNHSDGLHLNSKEVVDSLDGNPNEPIITGRVENAAAGAASKLTEKKQRTYKDPEWLTYDPQGLIGQDQETGEIIVFGQRSASGLNSLARPQSLVDMKDWDEVPQGIQCHSKLDGFPQDSFSMAVFSSSSHGRNSAQSYGPGLLSPRDAASGQATGKRK